MNNDASDTAPQGAINGVGQIAIAISDIDAATVFYRDVLGLPLLFSAPPGLAFFDCGGVRLMLTIQNGAAEDHHTSAIYYRVDDIAAAHTDLQSLGVEFERPPQMAAKMSDHELWLAFLRDPDHNLIGLMAELPLSDDE